jgi:S1-C subfamily serine protease
MGLLAASTDAAGAFELRGLPSGRLVDFAILPPRGDYVTDNQHRTMPLQGGSIDIGSVPLFSGPLQKLVLQGSAATGLWFHSQEGRPTVYSLVPGSAAVAAGARPGDHVLAVDDVDVTKLSSSVVEGLVATGGRLVRLTVESGGRARVLTVPRIEPGDTGPSDETGRAR